MDSSKFEYYINNSAVNTEPFPIEVKIIANLLNQSYEDVDDLEEYLGFNPDYEFCTDEAKLFYNCYRNIRILAFRGTSKTVKDWGNDLIFLIGNKEAYMKTQRFIRAKDYYEKVVEKYDTSNLIVCAHSQGGLIAQLLCGNARRVIIVNGACFNDYETILPNELRIRCINDVVSAFDVNRSRENLIEVGEPLKTPFEILMNIEKSHDITHTLNLITENEI